MFSYKLPPNPDSGEDQQYEDFCRCEMNFGNSDGSTYGFTVFPVHESTMTMMFAEAGLKINSMGPRLSCSPEGRELFPPDFIEALTDDWVKIIWYFDATKVW